MPTLALLKLVISSPHFNMGRSTIFLILAFVLLFHCFGLLSAEAAKENSDFANDAGDHDLGKHAAPTNDEDAIADAGKKNGRSRGQKHRSRSETGGRKVSSGKLASGSQRFGMGPGFGIHPAVGVGPGFGTQLRLHFHGHA